MKGILEKMIAVMQADINFCLNQVSPMINILKTHNLNNR